VERVSKSGPDGGLFDHDAGFLQALGGKVHFQSKQELVWALMVVSLEESAQMGGIDVALLGNFFDAFEPKEVLLDVLAAFLVGGK